MEGSEHGSESTGDARRDDSRWRWWESAVGWVRHREYRELRRRNATEVVERPMWIRPHRTIRVREHPGRNWGKQPYRWRP
jgi:hypothetical protein